LEVRVYPGADGDFEWYSDAGDTYDYENGSHRIVPIHWEDAARTLTLADSRNSYPGMPKRVHIHLMLLDLFDLGSECAQVGYRFCKRSQRDHHAALVVVGRLQVDLQQPQVDELLADSVDAAAEYDDSQQNHESACDRRTHPGHQVHVQLRSRYSAWQNRI